MGDLFVNQIQRVGDDALGLAPGQAAVLFDASQFDVTDAPDTIATSTADGGTITGVTTVSLKGAIVDQDNFLARQVSTGGVLAAGGGTVSLFAFRVTKARVIGAICITMLGGAWTADTTHYWRIILLKNGAGIGTVNMSVAGTGSIAQYATATLFAASTFSNAAAGDTYIFELVPISSPADLAVAEITVDLAAP